MYMSDFGKSTIFILFLSLVSGLTACIDKEFDPNDPKKSFGIAKEPYDDENWEIAVTKLGEYKARFPYSVYAVEADLLLANAQFSLEHFPEAAAAYEQFVKLHPKHPKVDFAMFRVGEAYWSDAPEQIDREQDYASKAVIEWEKLVKKFPQSPYTEKAKEFIAKGKRRIAESLEFIADFYYKKEIYHSCAYTFTKLTTAFPEFNDLRKKAFERAAECFDELAKEKDEDPSSDKNIYFKSMTSEQIRARAAEYRKKATSV